MQQKRNALRKNKAIALSLMIGAAVLFVIARYHKGSGWEWVAAFSEAAMVGALADWFAVVALFRHPLGVPIPHTAIIPNKKETIAENLAIFIRDKFLATESVVAKLRELNPAQHLATYLMSRGNAQWLAQGITSIISDSLNFLDDERVRQVLRSALNDRVEKFDLSTSAGALIDTLRKDNRHQAVLDDLLQRLGGWLATEEAQGKIATFIDNWLNTDYPLLSRFIPNRDNFAKGAGEKVAGKVNEFIQAVNADPTHDVRQKFDNAVAGFSTKLKSDEALREKIAGLKREAINNAQLTDYVKGLINDLKVWLADDLDRPDSRIQQKMEDLAVAIGNTLSKNSDLKDSINEHLEMMVRNYAETMQKGITKHIAGTVKQWDDRDFVNEIELSIGSDLQFIRMNGTLVGGMIGLLLHSVTLLLK
ncbi:DUF445 domain-containing protein [Geomonas sp. RF6]|uniref:DUF445 domain-containing protein n=1 Tax=Geomonas sp. RF6 TaxID=2897342 RepID=UPI001E367C3D|nr:DUF445 domain-containing protein [Geomonas sp. RF6]UFS71144.1 DUF445 domain-containing protein [Geomonas sp. RF6]